MRFTFIHDGFIFSAIYSFIVSFSFLQIVRSFFPSNSNKRLSFRHDYSPKRELALFLLSYHV